MNVTMMPQEKGGRDEIKSKRKIVCYEASAFVKQRRRW
jgi:hypothetical protein